MQTLVYTLIVLGSLCLPCLPLYAGFSDPFDKVDREGINRYCRAYIATSHPYSILENQTPKNICLSLAYAFTKKDSFPYETALSGDLLLPPSRVVVFSPDDPESSLTYSLFWVEVDSKVVFDNISFMSNSLRHIIFSPLFPQGIVNAEKVVLHIEN